MLEDESQMSTVAEYTGTAIRSDFPSMSKSSNLAGCQSWLIKKYMVPMIKCDNMGHILFNSIILNQSNKNAKILIFRLYLFVLWESNSYDASNLSWC